MAKSETADALAEIHALMAWWRDAGVDHLFLDEARALTAAGTAEAAPVAAARLERAAVAEAPPSQSELAPPATLGEFRQWWLEEPALDGGRVAGRVPPLGNEAAETMIVVEQPEEGDVRSLLSGPQGRFLDAILAAMGTGRERAYLPSVLVRPMPFPDWNELGQAGLGGVLRRHIALVRPKRLILLGGNILPLVGNHLPNSAHSSSTFNHEGVNVPVFSARDLASLMGRPSWKANFWRDWLVWKRDHPLAG